MYAHGRITDNFSYGNTVKDHRNIQIIYIYIQLRSLFLYFGSVSITRTWIRVFKVLGTDAPIILFNGGSFDFQLLTLVKTLIRRKDSGQDSIRTYQSLVRCFLLHRTGKSDKIGRLVTALYKSEIWNLFCWRKNSTKIITFFDDLVLSFCIMQSSDVVPFRKKVLPSSSKRLQRFKWLLK
jgi:hypothetical protein